MLHSTRRLRAPAIIVGVAFVLASGIPVLAGERPDYAGTYTVKPTKGKAANSVNTVLHVVQHDDAIEITHVESGRTMTSRFPLNGSEGDYTSPGGVAGKGKAQFKGKDLILESVVVTKPQPNGPNVRMRTRERWRLSSDSKVLTIRFDVDFPDLEALTRGVTDQSWTETYLRSDIP